MMKARAGNLVLLGLDRENVKRLQEGRPIKFDGAQVGLDGVSVGIIYGETLLHIQRDLQKAGFVLPDATNIRAPSAEPAPEQSSTTAPRDCQHGQLARQCPLCEREADRTDYAAIIREALASWEALGADTSMFNRQSVGRIFTDMRQRFDVARCVAELRPINPAAAWPFPPRRRVVTEGSDFDVRFREAPKPGEWIEWGGGEQPVESDTKVDVKFRNKGGAASIAAGRYSWTRYGTPHDIVAYRVVEAALAKVE